MKFRDCQPKIRSKKDNKSSAKSTRKELSLRRSTFTFNELVVEAARLSILNDGEMVTIEYIDNPNVKLQSKLLGEHSLEAANIILATGCHISIFWTNLIKNWQS